VVDGATGIAVTSAQSCITVDTAGTTISGGREIHSVTIHDGSEAYLDVDDLGVKLSPGDKLTFAVGSTASTTINVTANWSEDS
jgi:hypothetical protein